MKNWFQNLILKYPYLKFLGSRYILALLFFIVWMLFFDNQSYFDQRILDKQIKELEDNKSYYKEEIAKDKQRIKNLKSLGLIERFGRENYFMKRPDEDIYIIDIEDDRIKDSLQEAKH